MVTLVHVSKEYSRGDAKVWALRDVTLEIGRGEFCAFVGPSGCGKTTLLNLVGGLDLPTSGEIVIGGRSTSGFTSDEWTRLRRDLIGVIFQAFYLIPGLTAAENVALPLLLKGESGAQVRKRVDEMLELVGMRGRERHRPAELSGGEQQRLAIARALVNRPSLMLADEPTGNLDSKNGAEIIALLRSLPQQFGHTVLLVTHSAAAAQEADYVWHMRDGQLTCRTSPQLVSQGV
ncbi:MAG TPA: ABC transporter ATP-binding protein [Nitrospiraceae bacterium]|nr:ABC transporter ATP-binding protein [Nitrospiraceae bacterium]